MQETDSFDVSWRETSIFGDASIIAAKGQIAAGRQGRYADFHKALASTPVQVTYPYLAIVAKRQGLDLTRFEANYNAADTLADLGRAKALADIFGLLGTPALVVGRTLVVGAISETNLHQLITVETSELRAA